MLFQHGMSRPPTSEPSLPSRDRKGAEELVHDSLGSSLGFHNGVHVVGPDVRSQQVPAALRAMPLDGRQYHRPARFLEHIGIRLPTKL